MRNVIKLKKILQYQPSLRWFRFLNDFVSGFSFFLHISGYSFSWSSPSRMRPLPRTCMAVSGSWPTRSPWTFPAPWMPPEIYGKNITIMKNGLQAVNSKINMKTIYVYKLKERKQQEWNMYKMNKMIIEKNKNKIIKK